jgi:hypothetical protein
LTRVVTERQQIDALVAGGGVDPLTGVAYDELVEKKK